MLTDEERILYSRQIKLNQIGEIGQRKLKTAHVLVVGAGGLGCPVLQFLASVGVGNIGIIDDDVVSLSNLHRQILFDRNDIGFNKANVAKDKLHKINPLISITTYSESLKLSNCIEIIRNYQYVVDCTDNTAIRYLLNDACVYLKTPFVYAGIFQFEAQVSVFNYENGPTYRCLFPANDTKKNTTTCTEVGILGTFSGLVGLVQANEVLKMILGIGDILSSKLLVVNLLKNNWNIFSLTKKDIQLYRQQKEQGLSNLPEYGMYCSTEKLEITLEEAVSLKNHKWIDVRAFYEEPALVFQDKISLPFDELSHDISQLDKDENYILFCNNGWQSLALVQFLREKHHLTNVVSLKNGINQDFINYITKNHE